MLRPVSAYVGWRYLRAGHSNHFASFVSIASVVGVALGVAALIVVLSVMNGFENELRSRLLSMVGHATVQTDPASAAWRYVLADLQADDRITAASPFIEVEGMLSVRGALSGVVLSGIDPSLEVGLSPIGESMSSGSLADLSPQGYGLILGRALALRLGVVTGDPITVMVPRKNADSGLDTKLRQFTVVGTFELGLRDHDSVRGLVHIEDAANLAGLDAGVSGIRVTTEDVFSAPRLIREWQSDWSGPMSLSVRDWTEDNATYFRAIRIEKIMMTLLLSLVVAVAAFNIVATLVMVVTEKRAGIAIIRTLGYPKRTVIAIFAFQGAVLGFLGVLTGVILGILMARNVDTLAPALERIFGFEFMPADVYYLTALPADLQAIDVSVIALVALLMTVLATIYPAIRAANVAPAEVLRYE